MKTILLLSERFAVPVTVSLAPGRLALKEGRRPALAKDGATWLRLCPRVTEHSLHRPPPFRSTRIPGRGGGALGRRHSFVLNCPLCFVLKPPPPPSPSGLRAEQQLPQRRAAAAAAFFNFYFPFSVDIRYHFGSRCTASSQTFAHFSEAGPCGGAAWPAPGRGG